MSLLIHLAWPDARRFALLIAMWIAVSIGTTALYRASPLVPASQASGQILILALTCLWLARMGLAATLVALCLQTHPVIGSNAWWLTRPVQPQTLLASRLLIIGILLIGVPAACDSVLMALHNVPGGQIGRVLLEWSLVRGGIMVLLMCAAAVTSTFARFALLVGGTLVGGALVLSLALLVATTDATGVLISASSGLAAALVSRPDDPTALVVGWILVLTAGWLLLRTQYKTRSRARSIGVGLAGGIVALTATAAWPWPLLHAALDAPAWVDTETVGLEAPSQEIYFDNAGVQVANGPRWRTAHARVYMRGLPVGWFAMARVIAADMDLGGTRITGAPVRFATTLPAVGSNRSPTLEALQHALGVKGVVSSPLGNGSLAPIITARNSEVPAAPTAAVYRGQFEIDLLQLQEAAVLPLKPGAIFQEGAYRMVLEEVETRERGPMLRVRASWATSAFDSQPPISYSFFLRNRRADEAIGGTVQGAGIIAHFPGALVFGPFGALSPYGFYVESQYVRFPSTLSAQLPSALAPGGGYQWADDIWIRDADLVVIRTVNAGSVTRHLEIQGLRVSPR